MLAFSLGVTLLTGMVFGLAPAWQASRPGIGEVLKEGGRSSVTSSGRLLRNGLMIAEVALSIVLLVGAVLLLRSFGRITGVDPGFRAENVLAFRVTLPNRSYPEEHNRVAFFDALLARLATLPQVRAAGMVQTTPDARRLRAVVRHPGTAAAEAERVAVGELSIGEPRLLPRR